MTGVFEMNDGEKYLRITNFDVVLGMDDMKVFATGIFPEAELSKTVFRLHFKKLDLFFVLTTTDQLALEFVNQYWPSMYRAMIPETKDIWEPRMIQEMNAFLMKVPISKMLYYGES